MSSLWSMAPRFGVAAVFLYGSGMSPFFAMHGQEALTPIDVFLDEPAPEILLPDPIHDDTRRERIGAGMRGA